jgi:DNA repair protein RecN (Recombination protein N)
VLLELHVAGLGVIDDCRISLSEGLTALTGETGAGKTLLVDALGLVLGGRPRRGLVPPGRTALVEAVFVDDDGAEVILAREIPADGRAKAWIDGRMASAAALEERAAGLCDIYGQHEHQSLLGSGAPRRALDAFGSISTLALRDQRSLCRSLAEERAVLGGDPEAVQREIALLEHQVAEIDAAHIAREDEIDRLLETAQLLESAGLLRREIERGLDALDADGGGPRDTLSALAKLVGSYPELGELHGSLREGEAILAELSGALRRAGEQVEEDPERLDEVNGRIRELTQISRRYGPLLADVVERRALFARQLAELQAGAERRDTLATRIAEAQGRLIEIELAVGEARRQSAPAMAEAIEGHLAKLALERATVEVAVGGVAGDDVELRFSANPGLAPQGVAKVASGGELARLMLAIRLTMPAGPTTMVFDEVDAGIGGATARTLAAALREVAEERQVLVVTHLAQVAAVADRQIGVSKLQGSETTAASVRALEGEARIEEVARMLSGQPDSESARRHAAELLSG